MSLLTIIMRDYRFKMDNKQKALNLLGLAKRARKIETGESIVLKQIQAQRARYVFVGSNASENTKKKFRDKTEYYKIPISFEFTTEELSHSIGQQRTNIAIMDGGFASSFKTLLEDI